jgi:hypothetical protein
VCNAIDVTGGNNEMEESPVSSNPSPTSHYVHQSLRPTSPQRKNNGHIYRLIPPFSASSSTFTSLERTRKSWFHSRSARRCQGLIDTRPNPKERRHVIAETISTERGVDLIYEHFLLPVLNSLEGSERAEGTAESSAANGGQAGDPILSREEEVLVFSNFY